MGRVGSFARDCMTKPTSTFPPRIGGLAFAIVLLLMTPAASAATVDGDPGSVGGTDASTSAKGLIQCYMDEQNGSGRPFRWVTPDDIRRGPPYEGSGDLEMSPVVLLKCYSAGATTDHDPPALIVDPMAGDAVYYSTHTWQGPPEQKWDHIAMEPQEDRSDFDQLVDSTCASPNQYVHAGCKVKDFMLALAGNPTTYEYGNQESIDERCTNHECDDAGTAVYRFSADIFVEKSEGWKFATSSGPCPSTELSGPSTDVSGDPDCSYSCPVTAETSNAYEMHCYFDESYIVQPAPSHGPVDDAKKAVPGTVEPPPDCDLHGKPCTIPVSRPSLVLFA